MSNYLQRLIARAEGVTSTPSLIPNVRGESGRNQEPDPFAASLETDRSIGAHDWPESTGVGPTPSTLQPSTPLTEATMITPVPSHIGKRSRLIRRAAPADEMAQQETDARPPSLSKPARRVRDDISPEEMEALPPPRFAERREIKAESAPRAEDLNQQRAKPDERMPQMLRPVNEMETPPSRKGISEAEDEIRRINQLSQEMLERLARRDEAAERSSQSSQRESLTETLSASPFNLEPPRAEASAPAPPLQDEPRLIIGQLRVDVLPAAPANPREVVRVVTRSESPGRSSSVGSQTSKLRFGLGQM